jgi:hypothetical protein
MRVSDLLRRLTMDELSIQKAWANEYPDDNLKFHDSVEFFPHVRIVSNSQGVKFFFKFQKSKRSGLSYFKEKLQFIREIEILDILKAKNNALFMFPKLYLNYKNKAVILSEVKGPPFKECDCFCIDSVVKGMGAFQEINSDFSPLLKRRFLDSTIYSTNFLLAKIVLRLLFVEQDFTLFAKLFLKIIGIVLRNKPQKRYFLTHNDLFNFHNARYSASEGFGLIDFGQAKVESRWILLDVVDLCLNKELSCNKDLYLRLLTDIRRRFDVTRICERDQVWVAVFRQVALPRPYAPEWYREFFTTILMDERKFNEWYKINFLNVVLCD